MSKYFSFDPARDTEAAVWVATTGSIVASGANLTVNADTLVSLETFNAGALQIRAEIPVVPTAADDRKLGFSGVGNGGYAWFNIDDDNVLCQIADGLGNTDEVEINWSDGTSENWTNIATTFEVRWDPGIVRFFVNGQQRAALSDGVPTGPMSIYLHNANADDLDIKQVTVDGR